MVTLAGFRYALLRCPNGNRVGRRFRLKPLKAAALMGETVEGGIILPAQLLDIGIAVAGAFGHDYSTFGRAMRTKTFRQRL